MMHLPRDGDQGVSPILAILILIAITIVVAGVAAIWFFGFANTDDPDDDDGFYLFNVKLNGSNDNITFSIISGGRLNTTNMELRINDSKVPVPEMRVGAGTDVEVDSGTDLEPGSYYRVKIVIGGALYYDNELLASP